MQVDFSKNYFELFELPVEFNVQHEQLDRRYRSLQTVLHPDNFASAADAERRWSVQAASFVNEAYQTLSKPIRRAAYMLSLNGIELNEETDTQMSPEFLMQQMEWREALGDAPDTADPYAALDAIDVELSQGQKKSAAAFSEAMEKKDWQQARTVVRQWQFLDKLKVELRAQEARLDDGA